MSAKRSYLAAAFNARPFGMPMPPNWFGVAAFALLGAFVNPGLWLIGAGLEGLYLWALVAQSALSGQCRRGSGRKRLAFALRAAQLVPCAGRARAAGDDRSAGDEICDLLSRTGATESQMSDVRQMAWLHLKLLAARASVLQVISSAGRESRNLEEQERELIDRLAATTSARS